MTHTEFDAYLVVDWSANNSPNRGKNSIWYCLIERAEGASAPHRTLRNPPTRAQAFKGLSELLLDLAARGRAMLVGFDFAYGYPAGFAEALHLNQTAPWRAVWDVLSAEIQDDGDNRSNRFEVAAIFNAGISRSNWPFWGLPQGRVIPFLSATRAVPPVDGRLREFRVTDGRQRGPQSVWKICYAGSVGSQILVGIPYVARLRDNASLQPVSRVWPFETGFALAPRAQRDWTILHAEIYPSVRPIAQQNGECKDCAQVRGLAEFFCSEDEAGRLRSYFEPPAGLSEQQLATCISEEGWILGVR